MKIYSDRPHTETVVYLSLTAENELQAEIRVPGGVPFTTTLLRVDEVDGKLELVRYHQPTYLEDWIGTIDGPDGKGGHLTNVIAAYHTEKN